jgi:beta-lactamase regulating signal transducer with metallopeptidase domain/HEAT repeat protein
MMTLLLVLLKVTGFLVIALLATLALQRSSAGTRHMVWLIALAALLVVPVLAVWSPLPVAVLPSEVTAFQPVAPAAEPVIDNNVITEPTAQPANSAAPSTTAAEPVSARPSLTAILFYIWATVAGLLLLRLAYGAWSVRRIVRRGQLLEHPDWQTPLYEIADRLELDAAPVLLRSEDVKMPFAAGVFHSTIVLPAESDSWSAERRTAVLIHELGHIRRRDLIGHTLGRIACALYWFHPLVWTAARQLRAESERACDDLALVFGAKPSDYAEHLLDIVTCVRDHSTPAVALAMAHRKEFEGRMLAILNPELTRRSLGRFETVSLVGGLVVLAAVIGAISPVARAATKHDKVEQPAHQIADDTAQRASLPVAPVGGAAKPEPQPNPQPVARPNLVANPQPNPQPLARAIASSLSREEADSVKDERSDLLAKTLRTDRSAEVRRVAAWGLERYARSDSTAVAALINALQNDASDDVREMAGWALGSARRNGQASSALVSALRREKEREVRLSLLWAVGNVGDASSVVAILPLLSDENAGVREMGAWAIGNCRPQNAPTALVRLLKDPDRDVRLATTWALFTIKDKASMPALSDAFKVEKDTEIKGRMINALGGYKDLSVATLDSLITSENEEMREIAVKTLARADGVSVWPWPRPQPRPFP